MHYSFSVNEWDKEMRNIGYIRDTLFSRKIANTIYMSIIKLKIRLPFRNNCPARRNLLMMDLIRSR